MVVLLQSNISKQSYLYQEMQIDSGALSTIIGWLMLEGYHLDYLMRHNVLLGTGVWEQARIILCIFRTTKPVE